MVQHPQEPYVKFQTYDLICVKKAKPVTKKILKPKIVNSKCLKIATEGAFNIAQIYQKKIKFCRQVLI